ncbi:MAG: STAS domain-containing protein [Spirochaetaceae bacterium]|nr:STAS domain-containing protein [Spirochaetaceae bacterium]MBP5329582.1 STAS domain-containing protein [Spirochaetaceae bacterium]
MFKPELLNCLKNYSFKDFTSDFIAGVIVGVVALPLSIAFAIASGASPETGLYTAIVAGFCIAAFGGTRVQIGGPTGAFTVIIYGIINNPELGFSGLATATVLAGIMLILLGVFKMGGLVKFIPYTIVIGFTAGIAVTIASGQIGDFFGLSPDFSQPVEFLGKTYTKMPGDFIGKIAVYVFSMHTINWYSFAMSVICLAIIFLWPKITNRIPGSLVVIILATLANLLLSRFFNLHTDIINDRYVIPSSLPKPTLPSLSVSTIVTVFPTACSIAVLAAIESLLSAVVADGMIGTKHDSNTELIGQGIGNILSPLFGGLPATGAIARTATNIKNGGRTPIAGIVHALVLLVIVVFLGKYVVYIPMAALAAVLINVAWNMAGIPAVKALLKGQKSDICVLAVTFLITVFVDLTVAIAVGLGFAAFFFIKKMIDVSEMQTRQGAFASGIKGSGNDEQIVIPDGVLVYEIDGPLFFGTVRKFELAVEQAGVAYRVLIIRMRNTIYLDAGGIRALEQCKQACDRKKITIIISGIHTQPYMLMEKMGMCDALGKENIFDNITDALKRAEEVSNQKAKK